MKKITLTERELTKLVQRIVEEEKMDEMDLPKNIYSCGELGIKSPGYCQVRLVDKCAKFGIKSPGFCYSDTKEMVK